MCLYRIQLCLLQLLCNIRMCVLWNSAGWGKLFYDAWFAVACWENLKFRCYLLECEKRSEWTPKDSWLHSDLQTGQVKRREKKMFLWRSPALVLLLTLQIGKNTFTQFTLSLSNTSCRLKGAAGGWVYLSFWFEREVWCTWVLMLKRLEHALKRRQTSIIFKLLKLIKLNHRI